MESVNQESLNRFRKVVPMQDAMVSEYLKKIKPKNPYQVHSKEPSGTVRQVVKQKEYNPGKNSKLTYIEVEDIPELQALQQYEEFEQQLMRGPTIQQRLQSQLTGDFQNDHPDEYYIKMAKETNLRKPNFALQAQLSSYKKFVSPSYKPYETSMDARIVARELQKKRFFPECHYEFQVDEAEATKKPTLQHLTQMPDITPYVHLLSPEEFDTVMRVRGNQMLIKVEKRLQAGIQSPDRYHVQPSELKHVPLINATEARQLIRKKHDAEPMLQHEDFRRLAKRIPSYSISTIPRFTEKKQESNPFLGPGTYNIVHPEVTLTQQQNKRRQAQRDKESRDQYLMGQSAKKH